jgi:hypothetical protein
MKSKIMRGGEDIVDNFNSYKPLLYISFVGVFIILIGLVYILFFKKSDDILIPTPEPTNISTPESTNMSTPEPTKFNFDNKSEEVIIIRGQLENWGDDFNSLPDDLKEQAVYCLKNPDACSF